VNDVVGELRPLVERIVGSGVEVTFSLGSETGAVVVDRVRLERSLLNLIANARDAMEGQGRLVVHTFAVLHDGVPHAAIGVRDDGCGMPAALRARAFEPLFTTKAGKGSGLGLWLVHRFARDAGGSVEIRGDVADGTEVVVYLPRVTARTTRHGSGAFFERGTGADGNEEAKSACAR
jgi:C4-dicarboxylate-specific signal transduction histidine kinase